MRLNTEAYRRILEKNGLNDDKVCKCTGLSEKTFLWILDNGYIETSTLERIADAMSCSVSEIMLPDYENCTENVIEWQKDGKTATLTLSQRRTITKVKKLAGTRPAECQIIVGNKDGSICAHIPTSWIRINPGMELTREQKEEKATRFRKNVLNSEKGRVN